MESRNNGGIVLNEEWEEVNLFDLNVEQKVELPPCSATLELGGASFWVFLSVYSFLRCFSTFLFLSPFEMDEFAASVMVNESSQLFVAVHLSLMRAIRRYLGSAPLSRMPLNWDLLDSITWPVFVVEYLSLNAPENPIPDLSAFNPIENDYCKLPASAKLAILHQLCENLVKTEVCTSELSRRATMAENQKLKKMEIEELSRRATTAESGEEKEKAVEKLSRATMAESGDKKKATECYLCKMDGQMISCASCSAAVHARCVGEVNREGDDWHCPECRLAQTESPNYISTPGVVLLGADPHGRHYYAICYYLLVWDEISLVVYKSEDLPAVVAALDQSPTVLHERLSTAICEHWDLPHSIEGRRALSSSTTEARIGYVNLYEFAGIASSVSEEMASAHNAIISEQIIARQRRIIRGKHALFTWSNSHSMNVYLNSKKVKCGWCFTCKNPKGGRECLFIENDSIQASDVLDLQPENAYDIMCNVLAIERRLQSSNGEHVASLNKILLKVVQVKLQQLYDEMVKTRALMAETKNWMIKYFVSEVPVGMV